MRLKDLFEYDPKVAQAMSNLGSGGERVGAILRQPVKLTNKMSFVADHLEKLQQYIEKNPNLEIPQAFDQYLAAYKKQLKLDSLGVEYVPNKLLTPSNEPDSAYIRQVLGKMYDQVNKLIKQGEKDQIKNIMKPVDPRAGNQKFKI